MKVVGSNPIIHSMTPEEALIRFNEERGKLLDMTPETPAWVEQYKVVMKYREICYGKKVN